MLQRFIMCEESQYIILLNIPDVYVLLLLQHLQ